jgi:hypothetical protein
MLAEAARQVTAGDPGAICPPFVTTEDEVALIAQTIARVLDTYPA